MTTDANEKLQRIDEQLANLRETARSLSVEAGAVEGSGDLGARIGTLRGALDGLRSDVQDVRSKIEG
jgi:hypothetical protein